MKTTKKQIDNLEKLLRQLEQLNKHRKAELKALNKLIDYLEKITS